MKLRSFSPVSLAIAFALPAIVTSPDSQAAGVSVGASSLIKQLDYSDTFTGTDAGGAAARPYVPAVQPDAAYVVESTYGNPAVSFQIGAGFSFAADSAGTPGFVPGVNPYPTASAPNASGAGSDTGFTQTGGGGIDYGIAYGLRTEFIVQVDAVAVPDRIDISSGSVLGIFAPSSLSVFFRGDGSGNASLFNGTTDTGIQGIIPGFNTGITGYGDWHNYAVRYDMIDQEVELYVDQVSLGVIDLTTFAGGIYANFSNDVVGVGSGVGSLPDGTPGDRTWTDNFQVGAPVPEPAALSLLGIAALTATARRRKVLRGA